jgi:hypothetical protein
MVLFQGVPVKPKFPTTRPTDYQLMWAGRLRNTVNVTDPSYVKDADHGTGGLLFWFLNDWDPVELTLYLRQWQDGPELASVNLPLAKGQSAFILFDDYPRRFLEDRNKTYCEMWLISKGRDTDQGGNTRFEIYRRWPEGK